MMTEPKVSVLMPVYNCAKYLDQAIWSIRRQTFCDFEFVVVNDGSTDRSLQIISRHAKDDSRIICLNRPNGGIVDALNAGLDRCQGKFIARMDGDDVAVEHRLERQVAAMEAQSDLVALGGRVITTTPHGHPVGELRVQLSHNEIVNELLRGIGSALVHPAVMMRVEAVQAIGGYRSKCFPIEDLDLFFRLSAHGRIENLDEILLLYRRHPNSICATQSEEQRRLTAAVVADGAFRLGRRR